MRLPSSSLPFLLFALGTAAGAWAQAPVSPPGAGAPAPGSQAPAPQASTLAQKPGAQLITLDEAIRLALEHNHNLRAARTTIQQSQAEEITANLRPDPVLSTDAIFMPVFEPSSLTADYMDNVGQFDMGLSYLFERGKKRQHRLQAAQDATAVTRAQVDDNERTLTYAVANQFIGVELAESTLALANQDLDSFNQTVTIAEARYKAGDTSLDDLLKIKLQLLQFQMDVAQAKLAREQGLDDLRQLLGYESVPAGYDVSGSFAYQPVGTSLEDLQSKALATRPDLQAARLGVKAANSQYQLQKAIGKRDVTATLDYTHLAYLSDISVYGSMPLPIFDRNQGEIKRANFAISQAQEQQLYANGQVMTDVRDAYEGLQANNEIVQLYRSGYLDEAQQSRDITEYAYKRGAASLLDFLDAERSYRAAQLGYRQSLASYLTALEQLREAVGTRSLP
jgi:cobalt-zinc-cadmium efflux system outer membrane protein